MSNSWDQLYRLQDWTLDILRPVQSPFYLSGGTALSRGYYNHRYSDDLDFFLNDASDFALWRDRCLNALDRAAQAGKNRLEIILREERFGRAFVHSDGPALKIEFINDVPSRVGKPWSHPRLGLLDTKENILANKLTALLDRDEPKDAADIFWLCCKDNLNLLSALEDAEGKAAGIFPPLVAQALETALGRGVPRVAWIIPPSKQEFETGIQSLISRIAD